VKLLLYQTEEQLRKKGRNWDDEGCLAVCGIEFVPGKVSHSFQGLSPVKKRNGKLEAGEVKEELLMQSS